uniref:Cyclin Bc protein n=1 Tax=Oikopleura dioica TaxID=34765 RepID=I7HPL0_OIKDI|nr:Cyclin Bc protein [Oikopleura dioica]
MEARRLNPRNRLEGDGLVSKGIGGIAKQRTALGAVHGSNRQIKDEASKPHVRTTRAQMLRSKMVDNQRTKPAVKSQNQPIKRKAEAKKAKIEIIEEKPQVQEMSFDCPMDVSMSSLKSEDEVDEKLQEAIKKVEELDNKDDGNGGPYVNEIYDYTKYLEHAYAVKPRFLDEHKEVSHKMRTILVDWIVQVHQRFKLQNETLHLTVAIMDRYLSKVQDLPRKEMQMIGLTSMLLASKYEEIYMPDLGDFEFICDNAYTRDDFKATELEILDVLQCNLAFGLSIEHLRRFSTVLTDEIDGMHHSLGKYFLELALMDYDLCTFKPSIIAAGSMKLALEMHGDKEWDCRLTHFSGYKSDDLEFFINLLCKTIYMVHFTKSKYQAIKKKYSSDKLCAAAKYDKFDELKEEIYRRAKLAKEQTDKR